MRRFWFVIAFLTGVVVGPVSLSLAQAGISVSGGSPTANFVRACVSASGSQSIDLAYTNASGQVVTLRTLFVDSGCSQVVDSLGNIVSSTGPTAECSAASAFSSQLATTLTNAASKLGL